MSGTQKGQKFGISVRKEDDFHEWYTQVVLKSELIDYYDIRGFYVMRPSSMYMWSKIREYFDKNIGEMGVEECYFPTLVTKKSLEIEKNHLENFSPELAWVTTCGDKPLSEPVALRPTSEAIIYPFYAKWLRTYRDLPLRLNQWCSVVRWEVKSTLPFIRGREFLWQEGHSAFYDSCDGISDTRKILEIYASVYEDLLAVPVVRGIKSRNETFGGAEHTLTVEAFIPSTGRGVQAATSHFLGQNFSKMFDVKVVTEDGSNEASYVYQNSWGLTTRALGIAVMLHSDNRGLVCPPKVAKIQVVVVTCGIKKDTSDEDKAKLYEYANDVKDSLSSHFRTILDDRDNVTPGFKYNHWEIRGVPLRLEVGFKDLQEEKVTLVRRDNGKKVSAEKSNVLSAIKLQLEEMHSQMYEKAKLERDRNIKNTQTVEEFVKALDEKSMALIPWCGEVYCEKAITEKTTIKAPDGSVIQAGAKSLCLPFDAPSAVDKKCLMCQRDAMFYALFGLSY